MIELLIDFAPIFVLIFIVGFLVYIFNNLLNPKRKTKTLWGQFCKLMIREKKGGGE